MTDMSLTIAPKSDQLNSDDLISGPRTIRITRVSANPDSAEQPVSIFFEGDNGKPYKPCKSMRRVMVAVWGADGNAYLGRAMTIYRDPEVAFGGMKVGGIRISHMTDMPGPMTLALTATRATRKPYTVKPLAVEPASFVGVHVAESLKAARAAAVRGSDVFRDWCKQNPIWRQFSAEQMDELHKARKAADAADDPAPADPVATMTPDQIEAAMAQAAQEFLAKGDE